MSRAAMLAALEKGDADNFIVAATPGGIEAQERRGQQEFVNASKLPIEGTSNPKDRANFEALGIVFGEQSDDLFVNVTLPDGWRIEATENSRYSNLLDAQGRIRAGIFYKAAFYDRSAHVSLYRRFGYGTQPVGGCENSKAEKRFEGYVKDCATGKILYLTPPTRPQPPNKPQADLLAWYNNEGDALAETAKAWLVEYYPDYENVLAYWDEQ